MKFIKTFRTVRGNFWSCEIPGHFDYRMRMGYQSKTNNENMGLHLVLKDKESSKYN